MGWKKERIHKMGCKKERKKEYNNGREEVNKLKEKINNSNNTLNWKKESRNRKKELIKLLGWKKENIKWEERKYK